LNLLYHHGGHIHVNMSFIFGIRANRYFLESRDAPPKQKLFQHITPQLHS